MGPDACDIALIVLGAGLGSRFGAGDKLNATIKGRPVAHHVLSTLSSFSWAKRILVHHGAPPWSRLFASEGFELIENRQQAKGMLSSLHLGAEAAAECPRAMICLADMPLISKRLIVELLSAGGAGDCGVVATASQDYKGPPAIFATHLLQSLPKEGEGGARALLKNATFVTCELALLRDIDTVEDLKAVD